MATSPSKALECAECSQITANANARDFDECPQCESDATTAVLISPCPTPDEDCGDEDHHFGLDAHVTPVSG